MKAPFYGPRNFNRCDRLKLKNVNCCRLLSDHLMLVSVQFLKVSPYRVRMGSKGIYILDTSTSLDYDCEKYLNEIFSIANNNGFVTYARSHTVLANNRSKAVDRRDANPSKCHGKKIQVGRSWVRIPV